MSCLARLSGKAGFYARPHMLRHSFASELGLATKDPALVKELLGHASLTSTEVYLHAAGAKCAQRWTPMPGRRRDEPRSRAGRSPGHGAAGTGGPAGRADAMSGRTRRTRRRVGRRPAAAHPAPRRTTHPRPAVSGSRLPQRPSRGEAALPYPPCARSTVTGYPTSRPGWPAGRGRRPGNGGSRRRRCTVGGDAGGCPRPGGSWALPRPRCGLGPLSIGREDLSRTIPRGRLHSRPPPRCRASGVVRGGPRATWRPPTRKPGCARSITRIWRDDGSPAGQRFPCGRPVSASQPTAGCSACGGYPSWCALSCSMPLAAGCRRRFAPGRATCAATSTGCARQASPPYWTMTCAASTPTATMTTAASPAHHRPRSPRLRRCRRRAGQGPLGPAGLRPVRPPRLHPRFARTGCERWPGPGPAPRWCGCVRSPSCSTACNPSSCSPGCWQWTGWRGRTRTCARPRRRRAVPVAGPARPRPAPAGPTALARARRHRRGSGVRHPGGPRPWTTRGPGGGPTFAFRRRDGGPRVAGDELGKALPPHVVAALDAELDRLRAVPGSAGGPSHHGLGVLTERAGETAVLAYLLLKGIPDGGSARSPACTWTASALTSTPSRCWSYDKPQGGPDGQTAAAGRHGAGRDDPLPAGLGDRALPRHPRARRYVAVCRGRIRTPTDGHTCLPIRS